jgi:hypothetical protein
MSKTYMSDIKIAEYERDIKINEYETEEITKKINRLVELAEEMSVGFKDGSLDPVDDDSYIKEKIDQIVGDDHKNKKLQ